MSTKSRFRFTPSGRQTLMGRGKGRPPIRHGDHLTPEECEQAAKTFGPAAVTEITDEVLDTFSEDALRGRLEEVKAANADLREELAFAEHNLGSLLAGIEAPLELHGARRKRVARLVGTRNPRNTVDADKMIADASPRAVIDALCELWVDALSKSTSTSSSADEDTDEPNQPDLTPEG